MSDSEVTQKIAKTPTRFHVENMPKAERYLLIPRVSSENREYIPIGFLDSSTIASDAALIVPNATLYHFAILTSQMHMAWMRSVAGRLELRYRYSKDIVYNNFPWAKASEDEMEKIQSLGQAVLDARSLYPTSSLADLYDPLTMPKELVQAHTQLDATVDRLYSHKQCFTSDAERVAHLFALYEERTRS